jgi:membrane protease YdiL (CAAX protease family)
LGFKFAKHFKRQLNRRNSVSVNFPETLSFDLSQNDLSQLNNQQIKKASGSKRAFNYGWKAVISLFTFLFLSVLICIGSVFVYVFLMFGHWEINPMEIAALLDSPSTLAFQNLMTNMAFLLAIFSVIYRYNLPMRESFGLINTKLLNWILGPIVILSSSILIDQLLFWIFEGPLSSIPIANLAGNLNLAAILSNLGELNVFSFNLLLCLTLFVAPILEELFFRGFLWNSFRSKYSYGLCLFITSSLFGVIHFDLIQGINAFFIGLVYGFLVDKTKSIWPCILAHIVSSCFTFFLNEKGLSYGIGGNSYPNWLLLISLSTIILYALYLFLEQRKATVK